MGACCQWADHPVRSMGGGSMAISGIVRSSSAQAGLTPDNDTGVRCGGVPEQRPMADTRRDKQYIPRCIQ